MESKIKILHLEDISFDVELVERELNKGNLRFEKMVVDNKPDFEKGLRQFVPDIILSDHSLPSFDSTGAIKMVKEIAPHIPLILVTATVSEEFAVNVLQQGASDYILKTNLKRLPSAITGALGKAKMIREKQLAESELAQSYLQLRKLASHLQDIREEERSAIAREIHDELGQLLTGLKLDISWLTMKLKNVEEDIKVKVINMEQLVTVCLKTVRKISRELHPAILDKLGIIEAIQWQSSEFERRSGIEVELHLTSASVEISSKTAIALFRIFQESLTNITRHAQATKVSCSLEKIDEHIVLTVTDNGKGFDVNTVKHQQSLGLLSMKERTVMLGGNYAIASKPRKGTKVTVEVPLV